jgi:hypothetical protein
VIVVARPLDASMTATSPIVRASTDLYASRVPSRLELIENATVAAEPIRTALPSATVRRTTGCSNM